MGPSAKKRNIAYDIIRILAILMVLYNHRRLFCYYSGVNNVLFAACFASLSVLCKCGPALFFMISGALLLSREEPYKKVFTHRILKMLIVMAILACVRSAFYKSGGIPKTFLSGLNWYMYSYTAYLIALPFLRKMVKNMSGRDGMIFFAIAAAAYSFTEFLIPLSATGYSDLFTTQLRFFNSSWGSDCWHIMFPVLGYIIMKFSDSGGTCVDADKYAKSRKLFLAVLIAGSVISVAAADAFIIHDTKLNNWDNQENFREHAILLPACLIFYILYNAFKDKDFGSVRAGRILGEVSASIFGVFLIETHTDLLKRTDNLLSVIDTRTGTIAGCLISIVVEFVICSAAIMLLRKIPYVKKLI